MAGEIQVRATTGRTLYALVWNANGQVWNGATFEAYVTANLGNYDVALTEQGTASGKYLGTFPTSTAGVYVLEAFDRAGASPAETDTLVGTAEDFQWNGTSVKNLVVPAATGAAKVGTDSFGNNINWSVITQIAADLPQRITKNESLAGFPFFLVLSTDHVTGATGKTVTATRSLDGAAFASCANAVVEIANGWYKIDLDATDLNANTVALRFTAALCDDRCLTIVTEPT